MRKLLDLRVETVRVRAILKRCLEREKLKGMLADIDYAQFK